MIITYGFSNGRVNDLFWGYKCACIIFVQNTHPSSKVKCSPTLYPSPPCHLENQLFWLPHTCRSVLADSMSDVKDAESHTHLGLTLQSTMSWRKHIVQVYEKASKQLNMLKFVTYKLDRSILTSLYKSLIRPLMEYGDVTTVMTATQLYLIAFNMKLQGW